MGIISNIMFATSTASDQLYIPLKPGKNQPKYLLLTAFNKFKERYQNGEYDSDFEAFEALRIMSMKIEENFPTIGYKILQWILPSGINLDGVEIWNSEQLRNALGFKPLWGKHWSKDLPNAEKMILFITQIQNLCYGTPFITKYYSRSETNHWTYLQQILNNFISITKGSEMKKWVSQTEIWNLVTESINNQDPKVGAVNWYNMHWALFEVLGLITNYMMQIYAIGNPQNQIDYSGFNTFMSHSYETYYTDTHWDSNTLTRINTLIQNSQRFFGRQEEITQFPSYSFPSEGTPINLKFQNDPERFIVNLASMVMKDINNIKIIPLNSPFSGIKKVWAMSGSHKAQGNDISNRDRISDYDIMNIKYPENSKPCYWDVAIELWNGKIIVFEQLDNHGIYAWCKFFDIRDGHLPKGYPAVCTDWFDEHTQWLGEYTDNPNEVPPLMEISAVLNRDRLWTLMNIINKNMEFYHSGEHSFYGELNLLIAAALNHPDWYHMDETVTEALAREFCVNNDGYWYGKTEFWYAHHISNIPNPNNPGWVRFHDLEKYPYGN